MPGREKLKESTQGLSEGLNALYANSKVHSKTSLKALADRQARQQIPGIQLVKTPQEALEDKELNVFVAEHSGPSDAVKHGAAKRGKLLEANEGWHDAVRSQWTKGVPGADINSLLREADEADQRSVQALTRAGQTMQKLSRRASRSSSSRARSTAGSAISFNIGISRDEQVPANEEKDRLSRAATSSTMRRSNKRGEARPHSTLMLQPPQKEHNAAGEGGELSLSEMDPLTLIPFAVPFRGSSASMMTRKPPKDERPQSAAAQPFQFAKPINESMNLEEKLEGMLYSGSYHHRVRSDITSARQTRAGYGKTKDWAHSITKPIKEELLPRAIQDFVERKKNQATFMAEIKEAATRKPAPVPVSFEPQHTALPVRRGHGDEWVYQTIYLPKTLSKWNVGNVDPPYVNHFAQRPTWGPHFNSN